MNVVAMFMGLLPSILVLALKLKKAINATRDHKASITANILGKCNGSVVIYPHKWSGDHFLHCVLLFSFSLQYVTTRPS